MTDVLPGRLLELSKLTLFRDLSPTVLADLGRLVRETQHEDGELLVGRRTGARCVRWVVDGEVVWRNADGELGRSRAGAPVGLLRTLAEARGGTRAIASGPVRTLAIDAEDLFELFEDHFPVYRTVLGAVSTALARCSATIRPSGTLWRAMNGSAESVDFAERLVRLRMSRPFGRGHLRALAALARRSTPVQARHGARLWSAGDRATFGVLVLSGAARDGERRAYLGDEAGTHESLAGMVRTHDGYAEGSFIGLRIDAEALLDVCEDDDDFALAYLRGAAEELWDERLRRGWAPELISDEVPALPAPKPLQFKASPLASIG